MVDAPDLLEKMFELERQLWGSAATLKDARQEIIKLRNRCNDLSIEVLNYRILAKRSASRR